MSLSMILTTALTALVLAWGQPAQAAVVNKIVAAVGKQIITLNEVDSRVAVQLSQIRENLTDRARDEATEQVRRQTLEEIINEKLTEAEAERLKVTVTDREVKRAVESIAKRNRMTLAQFELTLARDGLSLDEFSKRIRIQLMGYRLANMVLKQKIFISDEEKKKLFQARKDQYKAATEYTLARVVLPAAAKALAQEIVTRAAKEDFSLLAEKYSKGPEAKDGGLLGSFSPDLLSPEIKTAVEKLAEGQVSQPVVIGNDLQIFKMIRKKELKEVTFAALEEEITQELEQRALAKKYDEWIKEVRQKSYVKIFGF